MTTLTTAEIAAKTAAMNVLQKELGWFRANVKPLIIGAVLGLVIGASLGLIL